MPTQCTGTGILGGPHTHTHTLVHARIHPIAIHIQITWHYFLPWLQSKPMVDLQSEKDERGQLVLTCVLFPQQSLDDTNIGV